MSSHLNLESLYRMLASPSAPPPLQEGEMQVGGFDPHASGSVVDLRESPSNLEDPCDQGLTQTAPHAPPPAPASPMEGAAPEAEGESYLAFLDQVDQKRTSDSPTQGRRRRSKGRGERSRAERSKAKPRDSQATKGQVSSDQPKESPRASAHAPSSAPERGDPPKRRRRRRKPSASAQGD